jgi:HAD superfamily hydrolase (TIGR01509 family)
VNLWARRHWIFDLDGTLTVAAHDFAAIRRALGIAEGRPILEALAALPAADAAPLYARLDAIELEIAARACVQAGAQPLLTTLALRGARLGILTRNSWQNACETLRVCGLEAFFTPACIIGREAAAPKPSADGIQRLLVHWGAQAEDAVMVGDYLYDLQAGRAAGTATVHVDASGRFPFGEHADVCVRALDELLAFATPA